jgi:hypothetical protein
MLSRMSRAYGRRQVFCGHILSLIIIFLLIFKSICVLLAILGHKSVLLALNNVAMCYYEGR